MKWIRDTIRRPPYRGAIGEKMHALFECPRCGEIVEREKYAGLRSESCVCVRRKKQPQKEKDRQGINEDEITGNENFNWQRRPAPEVPEGRIRESWEFRLIEDIMHIAGL